MNCFQSTKPPAAWFTTLSKASSLAECHSAQDELFARQQRGPGAFCHTECVDGYYRDSNMKDAPMQLPGESLGEPSAAWTATRQARIQSLRCHKTVAQTEPVQFRSEGFFNQAAGRYTAGT